MWDIDTSSPSVKPYLCHNRVSPSVSLEMSGGGFVLAVTLVLNLNLVACVKLLSLFEQIRQKSHTYNASVVMHQHCHLLQKENIRNLCKTSLDYIQFSSNCHKVRLVSLSKCKSTEEVKFHSFERISGIFREGTSCPTFSLCRRQNIRAKQPVPVRSDPSHLIIL